MFATPAQPPSTVDRLRELIRVRPRVKQLAVGLAAFVLFDIVAVSIATARSESDAVSIGSVPTQLGSSEAADIGARAEPLAPQPLPIEVAIPVIKVKTQLVDLHVTDGELSVPKDYSKAGWWTEGIIPGQTGPAVIVGHVDSTRGAAVFFRVRELKPGDLVTVTRADGSTIAFKVDAVKQAAKDKFPTKQVYGYTDAPTLRLITCGGKFDEATGHYEDNVIVFATIVPPTPPPPLATEPAPSSDVPA